MTGIIEHVDGNRILVRVDQDPAEPYQVDVASAEGWNSLRVGQRVEFDTPRKAFNLRRR